MTTTNRSICLRLSLLLLVSAALLRAPEARAADLTAGTQNQLVSAINAVNSAGAGNHTITLTADITLTSALPALTNAAATEVVLDGDGHTLTGDDTHTILKIVPGATVRVRQVTLTHGYGNSGPGEVNGGAIYNAGHLTVEDAQLTQNNAVRGGAIYIHGGASNTAELVLTRVRLTRNFSSGDGAGLAADAAGGGVAVVVSQSVFDNNSSSNRGGGVAIDGQGGEAHLTVESTAIVNNSSPGRGGGLYIDSHGGVATALLFNSTVANNQSPFEGGGIAVLENNGQAELGLTFVTIAGNGGIAGSALYNVRATITVAASILSSGQGNSACADQDGPPFALTSAGYNLGDDGTCGLSAATDIPDGNPILHSLQPTPTPFGETYVQEIDTLSDAQRRVPTGVLGCGTTVAQDQRGQPRPLPGALCDVGAYESAAATCAPPYAAANEAGLNWAIACVNGAGAGAHTISLTADVTLTDWTTSFNNPAATEIILDGDGHTIDGNGNGPILWIESGTTARVREVTLTGGQASVGAAILNLGALTVENSTIASNAAEFAGGGIKSEGNLTIVGSTLRDNTADYGGSLHVSLGSSGTTLLIRDTAITNSEARVEAGGLQVSSGPDNPTGISLSNVTLDANRSPNGTAGAQFLVGTEGQLDLSITGTRIVNNVGYQGGLAIGSRGMAEITVTGSTVAGNRSTAIGGISESSSGGIYVRASEGGTTTLTLLNSTLSGNSTGRAGGGLLVVGNGGAAEAQVVFSTLAGNTSGTGGGGIHTVAVNGGTASARLSASIISNSDGAGPDCARPSGSILSSGYNLAGDGTCFLTQSSDLPASAAGLLPLALNAPGSTPTHALAANSPARDRIPQGELGCGATVATDQRGAARPQPAGGQCDIGAFEYGFTPATEFQVYLPMTRR